MKTKAVMFRMTPENAQAVQTLMFATRMKFAPLMNEAVAAGIPVLLRRHADAIRREADHLRELTAPPPESDGFAAEPPNSSPDPAPANIADRLTRRGIYNARNANTKPTAPPTPDPSGSQSTFATHSQSDPSNT